MTLLTDLPVPRHVSIVKPSPDNRRSGFQTDVEGLRALAVLGVVAFHASVPLFSGGFVGVDVFLVISGYLITDLLLREAQMTGRIKFGAFFARRARRILPAAALVMVATTIAAWCILPLLSVYRFAQDLLAAAFYAANWRFISAGTDYLAGSKDHSPVLHFWSLAVEEQFYLVWPGLVLGAVLLARRRRQRHSLIIGLVVGTATVVSFTCSALLTICSPGLAYMATHTRAWQFGAACRLLAQRHGQLLALPEESCTD